MLSLTNPKNWKERLVGAMVVAESGVVCGFLLHYLIEWLV